MLFNIFFQHVLMMEDKYYQDNIGKLGLKLDF